MNKRTIVAYVALTFTFITAAFLGFTSFSTTRLLVFSQQSASQTVSTLESVNQTAESANQTANANFASATSGYATAYMQANAVSTSRALVSTQVANLSSQLSAERVKVLTLEEANQCDSKPVSINYSGNATVSDSIKTWLENTQGKVNTVDWDSVWGNSRTSIHKLTGEYLFIFIVYFNEPDLGYKNAVYDVGNMCWLDR